MQLVTSANLDLDDERVLVLVRLGGRGKTSGLELGETAWAKGTTLFHVRDRKVTKLAVYLDREHAFADLGLGPETEPHPP